MQKDRSETGKIADRSFLNLLRRLRLRSRLEISFLLISLLPIFLFSLFSIRIYSNSIEQKLLTSTSQSVQILSGSLSILLSNYDDYIQSLSVSDEIQDALSSPGIWVDEFERYSLKRTLSKLARKVPCPTSSPVNDFCVVNLDQTAVFSYGTTPISEDALADIIAETERFAPNAFLCFLKTYTGAPSVAICRKIFSRDLSATHIGYILIFIDPTVLENMLPISSFPDGSSMVLADSAGTILAAQDYTMIGQSLAEDSPYAGILKKHTSDEDQFIQTEDALILSTYHKTYNLYMIAVIPTSFINVEIVRVQRLLLLLVIPVVLACTLFALVIYRSITQPINRIISVYDLSNQLTSERICDNSPDELGILARSIDLLADKNQVMLEQIQADDQRKREMELEVLQYQINPHFLLNTLNTLKWIAALNDVPVLSDAIASLSMLMQNILVNKDEFVSLNKEIQYLKDYCMLQSLRYAGRFEVQYSIDSQVQECLVPRFLLQPLVENSIIHGVGDNDEPLTIRVCAGLRDGCLEISISDDGVGFCIDSTADNGSKQFTGIGISNVNNRLMMYYGSNHHLHIQSCPGQGTTCLISIPLSDFPNNTSEVVLNV